MARIIVNSDPSYQRGDVKENRSHPGTNGDDKFIISSDSHGYPQANDDEQLSGGRDTFYLNTDIKAKNKTPHPYQEGGGIAFIKNFGSDDQIVIPKNTSFDNILIFGYGYSHRPYVNTYTTGFEIVHDPHGLYWSIFGGESMYDMSWLEGNTRIIGLTSRNTAWHGPPDPEPDPEHGDSRAISAKLNQLRNPEEWEAIKKTRQEELKQSELFKSGRHIYAADRLAEIETVSSTEKPALRTVMKQIIDTQGTSLYEYAFNNKSKSNHNDTDSRKLNPIHAPKKFNKKSADKISNFNPSTDTLEIGADSFGIDSSAKFAAAKNKRKIKKLAKKDFDFLYDQKKGGLYFNENGADKGFGDGGIIAILKGAPELTASNLEFI